MHVKSRTELIFGYETTSEFLDGALGSIGRDNNGRVVFGRPEQLGGSSNIA